MDQFDVVVIGAGPGGYVAAIRASQLGLKTAIVEKQHLGGICLNWGCIPTKALLKSSEKAAFLKHAADFGFDDVTFKPNFEKIIGRSRGVADQLSKGIAFLLGKNKVTIFEDEATLKGSGKIALTKAKKDITAKNIILATGARAKTLGDLEADGEKVWTYKHALAPKKQPKSMVIVGSGAIGIEFASFYHHMGTKVTVLEAAPRIVPAEDEAISAAAEAAFKKQGLNIETGVNIHEMKPNSKGISVTFEKKGKKETLEADVLLLAVGVKANIENLGLENTKIKTPKGFIETDAYCETAEKGLYAIGDVAAPPWLAHKASHEGVMVAEKIAGHKVKPIDPARIPACTYTNPQIASIGYSEAKAKELKLDIKVGQFPLIANGKAVAIGDTEGFIKTIFDAKTGELLGAHMIGPEVTEMVQGFAIAKTLETTEEDLMHTIFPHPTLSESMHEAVLDAFGKAIHFSK